MRNFVQDGTTINVKLTQAVKGGEVVKVGGMVGIAVTDGAVGDTITLNTQGVYGIAKGGSIAFVQGQKVYKKASKELTSDAQEADNTANTFVGHAWEDSPAVEDTVEVKINF